MVTKGDIALIIVCFLVVFSIAFFYFSGNPMETFMSYADKAKQLAGGLVNKYVEGFKQNPLTVIGTTVAAVAGVGTVFHKAYSYLKSSSAAQIEQANVQKEEALTSATELEKELATYKDRDTTISRLVAEKEEALTKLKDVQLEADGWKNAYDKKCTELQGKNADYEQLLQKVQPKDPLLKQQ